MKKRGVGFVWEGRLKKLAAKGTLHSKGGLIQFSPPGDGEGGRSLQGKIPLMGRKEIHYWCVKPGPLQSTEENGGNWRSA